MARTGNQYDLLANLHLLPTCLPTSVLLLSIWTGMEEGASECKETCSWTGIPSESMATGCRGDAVMSSERQARKARPVHQLLRPNKLRGCPFLWMS